MPKDKKVYVIGQDGLEEELDNLNIARCGGTVSPTRRKEPSFNPEFGSGEYGTNGAGPRRQGVYREYGLDIHHARSISRSCTLRL